MFTACLMVSMVATVSQLVPMVPMVATVSRDHRPRNVSRTDRQILKFSFAHFYNINGPSLQLHIVEGGDLKCKVG